MATARQRILAALQAPYNIDSIKNSSPLAVGDATAEIKEVQGFLKHFGYLRADDKYTEGTLDQVTSNALGAYQVYQNINKTGVLDEKTKATMSLSRCGFPDALDPLAFNTTPQGWNRRRLTFTHGNLPTQGVTAATARASIRGAFDLWANTGLSLTFVEVANNESPDIFIEWRPAKDPDHSMVGNILAHADFPPGSSITTDKLPLPLHFDKDEHTWVDGAVANGFDIQTVAIHEIGHLLGMYHSSVAGAIMYPSVSSNWTIRKLHADDIAGITKLYPALAAPAPTKFIKHTGQLNSDLLVIGKSPDRVNAFFIGIEKVLYEKYRDAGTWGPPGNFNPLGENCLGTPVGVSTGPDRVDLFVYKADKAIYHKWFAPSIGWTPSGIGFNKVGGTMAVYEGGFTAMAWRGSVHLFARGPDNAVYSKTSNNNTWNHPDWENLGGNIVGNISAVSNQDRIDLFARKADRSLVHKYWTTEANRWLPSQTEWESLGGEVREDPIGASWGPGRVDVFTVGLDSKLYSKWWDGKWNPSQTGEWYPHEGAVTGKPSAVGWGDNRLDVFIHGNGGSVLRKSLKGTAWTDYVQIGDPSQVSVDLGPIVNPIGTEKPDIFVRGTDKGLWTSQ